jgi:hypothetical protein
MDDIDKKWDRREKHVDRAGKFALKIIGVIAAIALAATLAWYQLRDKHQEEDPKPAVEQVIPVEKEVEPIEDPVETEELYVTESYYWIDEKTGIEYLIRVWNDGVEEEIELH